MRFPQIRVKQIFAIASYEPLDHGRAGTEILVQKNPFRRFFVYSESSKRSMA